MGEPWGITKKKGHSKRKPRGASMETAKMGRDNFTNGEERN